MNNSLQSPASKDMFNERVDIAKTRLVVLSEGRAGHQSQSVGVAEMLGVKDPEILTLKPKWQTHWWGRLLKAVLPVEMVVEDYERLLKDMRKVDVVIGAGYLVSRVLKDVKERSPRIFTVCLMKPAGKLADYDVVALPQHSKPKAEGIPNIVITLGAPNRITRDRLEQEADRWRKRLAFLKGLRLAVVVGGTSRHGVFTPEDARQMIETLAKALKDKGSLMVTTSRRTGPAATAAIEKALEKAQAEQGVGFYFWQPEDPLARDNPYHAYLALADAVLVTADSASMASEAATSGKPVYLWGDVQKQPKKFQSFYTALVRQGRAKWWDGALNLRAPAGGLMDTLMVAGFIRAKWMKK